MVLRIRKLQWRWMGGNSGGVDYWNGKDLTTFKKLSNLNELSLFS
ncbi:MAG: hypothetical protein JWQ54_813 [Mucilaginibacter sp.]|nr:hypothetical protein [Mucilaginibacter sp.]